MIVLPMIVQRRQVMTIARLVGSCLIITACAFATPGFAQGSVKVGMLLPMTGPFTSTGKQLVAGTLRHAPSSTHLLCLLGGRYG
jgi:hypothetical protein